MRIGLALPLALTLLLLACTRDEVERPTNEEQQQLDDVEAMLDEE